MDELKIVDISIPPTSHNIVHVAIFKSYRRSCLLWSPMGDAMEDNSE